MAEFDQDKFNDALEKFYRKLENLHGSIGRGTNAGVPGKKTGPVPRSTKAVETPGEKERERLIKKANEKTKLGIKLTEQEQEAIKESTEALDDETKARKESEWQTKQVIRGFKNFGETLFSSKADVSSALGSLGETLKGTDNRFANVLGGVVGGMGFILGGLMKFAEGAADVGQFADLSKFTVGSVRSMKVMSGLGDSFTKLLDESQGRFRAFGTTSQEAAENLSNLSRGLKYGSGYLNKTLKDSLGKDLVASVDRASAAAAAMGMSDEERAVLMGQIARSSSMAAKNEQDAQQRLVKQYAETIENTRSLSNTFGISTKTILKAMEDFRNSVAGKIADLTGNEGAKNIAVMVQQLGITDNAEAASRIALALSEGNEGLARKIIAETGGERSGAQQQILTGFQKALEGSDGGKNMAVLNKNLEQLRPELQNTADELRDAYRAGAQEYAAPAAQLGTALKNMKFGPQAEAEKGAEGKTTEADNIQSMNKLTAALESLRNVIITLTAGLAAVTGAAGAVALGGLAGGAGTAILGKLKDKIGGKIGLGSKEESKFSLFDAIFGSKGADDVAKVEKTSSSIGSILKDMGKGIQSFLTGLGKGIGKGIEGIMTGLAAGLRAFANPQILIGAAILSGSIAVIGLGAGAALWALGKGIASFSEGLKVMSEVDGGNLIKVGLGLGAIGAGMMLFSAGMLVGTGTGVIAGLASIFGVKSPLERVKEFVPMADKIGILGLGIKNFGEGVATLSSNISSLDLNKFTGFKDILFGMFSKESPLTRLDTFGPIADKISLIGIGIKNFGDGLATLASNLDVLNLEKFANFKDILVELSNVNVPPLDGLSIPSVSTDVQGNTQQQGAMSAILNNPAVTPEVIAQLMSYLANIENDLQAIRGNTRSTGFDAPVRLS